MEKMTNSQYGAIIYLLAFFADLERNTEQLAAMIVSDDPFLEEIKALGVRLDTDRIAVPKQWRQDFYAGYMRVIREQGSSVTNLSKRVTERHDDVVMVTERTLEQLYAAMHPELKMQCRVNDGYSRAVAFLDAPFILGGRKVIGDLVERAYPAYLKFKEVRAALPRGEVIPDDHIDLGDWLSD